MGSSTWTSGAPSWAVGSCVAGKSSLLSLLFLDASLLIVFEIPPLKEALFLWSERDVCSGGTSSDVLGGWGKYSVKEIALSRRAVS